MIDREQGLAGDPLADFSVAGTYAKKIFEQDG